MKMRNMMILFFVLLSIVGQQGKSQSQSNLINKILKIRSDYVADSIPDIFRYSYKPFIYSDNKQFYDTLKTFLPEILFFGKTFYWIEDWSLDHNSQTVVLLTDSFMLCFEHRENPQWPKTGEKTIYVLEINDNLNNISSEVPYWEDFVEWNEYITNSSYQYFCGAGDGYYLCSKMKILSDIVEITNTAFHLYSKECPLLFIREQPEDNYKPRLQVNCDWMINERRHEIVLGLIEMQIENGRKVFDCEGNEIKGE
jgi:hypothetical protein